MSEVVSVLVSRLNLLYCKLWFQLCLFSCYLIVFDSIICSLQFLYGSAHVMKQPLFRQACELAFAESKAGENDYILEDEVICSSLLFPFLFPPLYICLAEF